MLMGYQRVENVKVGPHNRKSLFFLIIPYQNFAFPATVRKWLILSYLFDFEPKGQVRISPGEP